MSRLTYRRAEWVDILREIRETYRASAPSGLVARIEALLSETPAQWGDQACALELDTASRDVVQNVVALLHGQSPGSAEQGRSAHAVTEAASIIREHQRGRESPTYRVEHRSGTETTVIARTSDVHARQAELSHYAARLMANGATGELVLVEEATGAEVARRVLTSERSPPPDTAPCGIGTASRPHGWTAAVEPGRGAVFQPKRPSPLAVGIRAQHGLRR